MAPRIAFRPLTLADAIELSAWRYPPPYDVYDADPDDDPAALLASGSLYLAAEIGEPGLAAFVCLGPDAQVPGGHLAGLYREPLVDIGLGMRPSLTGRGLGLAFVHAALAAAERRMPGDGFRLSVAAFNRRARVVYQRAGFVEGPVFVSPVDGEDVPFLLMRRRNAPPSFLAVRCGTLGADRR